MTASTPRWLMLLLTAGLAVGGVFFLDDYGVTWDEALGDFFFGERYLSYFSSFDSGYLAFDRDPYPEGRSPDLAMSPFRGRPWEYYPVANLLAAGTSSLLSRWLGLLDPFDGFHAVNLWLGALFVWLLVRTVESAVGRFGALVAVLLLFTSPRLVCHWLANSKDFPEMVLFASTLLVFHWAWQKGSVAGVLAAGGLSGLALGAKANAAFLPGILLFYLLVGRFPKAWAGRSKAALVSLAAASAAGFAVFVGSWPYLWGDLLGRLGLQLDYVLGQVGQVRPESLLSPLLALFGTTPIPFLVLWLLGLGLMIASLRRRDPLAALVISWTAVVLGRLFLPGAVNFDGVRHFLELFPAMALAAGVGAQRLRLLAIDSPAARLRSGHAVATVLVGAISLGPGAVATVTTHPHQIAYWNALVGGLSGAVGRAIPQAGDYWGLSYRQGLRWINENLPPDSVLAVPVAEHTVNLVGQLWLRPDIGLAHVSRPTRPEIPLELVDRLRELGLERPLYVMFVPRTDWLNALMVDCLERLAPVHAIVRDGVPLLLIYRYPGDSGPQGSGSGPREGEPAAVEPGSVEDA